MSFKVAFAFWFVMVLIAIGNGFFAEKILVRHIGDYGSHLYKTFLIVAVIFIGSYIYMAGFAEPPLVSTALKTGFFWLSCSIVFEFIFGHYAFGFPWERLLADYRIWEGRLWSLVLASEIAGPLLAAWLVRG
ncbi:MAG: hypothetical protein H3C68_07010 [Deltaproteobacteria bacterium]|nr:hypothetical protein [Deltaproteobacteria bacterium]MBZ0219495.1 hypothetical protein [Deltaproteobacteria bacterium]